GRPPVAGRWWRAVPQLHPQRPRDPERGEDAEGMAAIGDRFRQELEARPSRHHSGRRIPRSRRRRDHCDAVRRRSGRRIEKIPRAVPADPGEKRKSVSVVTQTSPAAVDNAAPEHEWRPPSYWPFLVPAMVVLLAVIILPWVFTIVR